MWFIYGFFDVVAATIALLCGCLLFVVFITNIAIPGSTRCHQALLTLVPFFQIFGGYFLFGYLVYVLFYHYYYLFIR